MEKHQFGSMDTPRRKRVQDLLLENWTGFVEWVDEYGGIGDIIIRLPSMSRDRFDALVGSTKQAPKDSLSALADDVINTIVDSKEKEAFKKFANLLIEKVEKK